MCVCFLYMEGREKTTRERTHEKRVSCVPKKKKKKKKKISCVLECQRGMPGHVLSIYIPHCIVCVYVICWCYFAFNSWIYILMWERVSLLTRSGSFKFFFKDPTCSWFITNSSWKKRKKKKFHSHGWIDQLYSSEIFLFIWCTICWNLKSLRWRCWAGGDWRAN